VAGNPELEAVWSVEFLSSAGAGGNGIAVFDDGRIFGGNETLIYTGRYEVVSGVIHAEVRVETYALAPGADPGQGFPIYRLKVTGPPDPNNLFLSGFVVSDPARTMTIRAVRRAELP
jgi:hypothetical protein